MSAHHKIAAGLLAASLSTGIGLTAIAPASAAPATQTVTSASVSFAGSASALSTPAAIADGTSVQPQAVPIWLRFAIKVAMKAVKKVSSKTYYTIYSKVLQGRSAWGNWYVNHAPQWLKDIFPKASAQALYDALVWFFGLS